MKFQQRQPATVTATNDNNCARRPKKTIRLKPENNNRLKRIHVFSKRMNRRKKCREKKQTERAKEERYTQQYIYDWNTQNMYKSYIAVKRIVKEEGWKKRSNSYYYYSDGGSSARTRNTFAALSPCDARCIRRSISNRSWFNRFGDDFVVVVVRFVFMFLSPFDVVCMWFRFNFSEDYVDMQTNTRNENCYESDEAKMRAQLIMWNKNRKFQIHQLS